MAYAAFYANDPDHPDAYLASPAEAACLLQGQTPKWTHDQRKGTLFIPLTDSASGGYRGSGTHFSLLVVERPRGGRGEWQARHFDSLRGTHTSIANRVLAALRGAGSWSRLNRTPQRPNVPQQGPGNGCGVYTAFFTSWVLAERAGRPLPLEFTTPDETTWRAAIQQLAEELQPLVPPAESNGGRRTPAPARTRGPLRRPPDPGPA